MKNAAKELAFLLEQWRVVPNGQPIYVIREMGSDSLEQWRLQVRAAELLGEVDRALQSLSAMGVDVEHYREFVVAWARGVFAPDFHWGAGAQGTTELFPSHVISMLKATGDFMDQHSTRVEVRPEDKVDSISALDDITTLIGEMELPEGVRRYLFELISSCRTVLQEAETFDSVDLFARIHELAGVLTALLNRLTPEGQESPMAQRFQDLIRRLVPYGVAGRIAAGALEAGANLKQITGA